MTRVLIDEDSYLVDAPTVVVVVDHRTRWPLAGHEYVIELPSGHHVVVQQEEALTVN